MKKSKLLFIPIILLFSCENTKEQMTFLQDNFIGTRYFIGTDFYQSFYKSNDSIIGFDFQYANKNKIKSSALKIFPSNGKILFTIHNFDNNKFKEFYLSNIDDTSVTFKNMNDSLEPLFIKEVFVKAPYSLAWGNFYSKKLYRYDMVKIKEEH